MFKESEDTIAQNELMELILNMNNPSLICLSCDEELIEIWLKAQALITNHEKPRL